MEIIRYGRWRLRGMGVGDSDLVRVKRCAAYGTHHHFLQSVRY